MFKHLSEINQLANVIPAPVYWADFDGVLLGANDATVYSFGFECLDEMVGKKIADFFLADEMIRVFNRICDQIRKTGKVYKHKELVKNNKTGQLHCFKSVKSPLLDHRNIVIGFINVSIELTSLESLEINHFQDKKADVLKYLEILASILPINLYWEDVNSVVLGGNEAILKAVGAKSTDTVLGKSLYEFYPYDMADRIVQHNNEVMRAEKVLSQEETITDITTGDVKHFIAIKAPLRDDDQNIIGIVGTSIDITAEKEKFIKVARKVAHDINSPLASLKMMMTACGELPEFKRNILNQGINSIIDIANNLLNTYKKEEQHAVVETELREPLLISDMLVQLLSEKKMQYSNRTVRFEPSIDHDAQFAFALMQPSQFRRSLSNLINNAVDAIQDANNGMVTITLSANPENVVLTVQDNGKGMTQSMVEKMLGRESFTDGKENGHGIGLQQVWDTIDNNTGNMTVHSTPGEGTTIQLTFPRTEAANWIAHSIRAAANGIIVILDDDESIHGAWDMRFRPHLNTHPTLVSHHFTHGEKVLDFFNSLDSDEKERVLFLSDYELIGQNKNGLQIIEECGIGNTTLVTSYYANPTIRDKTTQLGIKLLPKQMASIVPIEVY